MRIDYPDGSFMLSWQFARAWYDKDGNLLDCEKKYTHKGYPAARAIPEKHTKVRQYLAEQGKQTVHLFNSGIIKRQPIINPLNLETKELHRLGITPRD